VQFRIAHFGRATIKIPDHPVACGATPPELRRGLHFVAGKTPLLVQEGCPKGGVVTYDIE
jgi:hypothetical protein